MILDTKAKIDTLSRHVLGGVRSILACYGNEHTPVATLFFHRNGQFEHHFSPSCLVANSFWNFSTMMTGSYVMISNQDIEWCRKHVCTVQGHELGHQPSQLGGTARRRRRRRHGEVLHVCEQSVAPQDFGQLIRQGIPAVQCRRPVQEQGLKTGRLPPHGECLAL